MLNIMDFLHILECPQCRKGDLSVESDFLSCFSCKAKYRIIDGVPDLVVAANIGDKIEDGMSGSSYSKWNDVYSVENEKKDIIGFGVLAREHVEIFAGLKIMEKISSGDIVLDVGCGKGYVASALSKLGKTVIGIDFVLEPLLFAKRKFEKENLNGIFIRADMFNLPFKRDVFKFVYSLGVLEHHKDMNLPAREMLRVIRDGGVSLNVVPAISIPSLTYAQLWGSIPNIPMIKDMLYWFHHILLRGKHCIYGYELNYSEPQIKNIFREAGFGINDSKGFNITVPIYSMKNQFLKSLAKKLITNRLFTRHIYVYSEKTVRGECDRKR